MDNSRLIAFDFDNLDITVDIYDGFYSITDVGGILHAHNKYELFFVLSGNTDFKTVDSTHTLHQYDICIVPPGVLHYSPPEKDGLTVAGIFFSFKRSSGKVKRDFYSVFDEAYSSLTEPRVLKNKRHSISYLKRLIPLLCSDTPLSSYECRALCSLIFTDITKGILKPQRVSDDSARPEGRECDARADIIADYMEKNYMNNISLKSLSEVLHICEKHTSIFFKKSFNMYFKEYLAELRIDAAKKLILNTDKSLSEIAETVGYNSYNGFYGFFKRITGISPEEYRQKAGKHTFTRY